MLIHGGVFPFDDSYDLYEFNFANVVNYAELACLMAPRPFMAGAADPKMRRPSQDE